MGKILYWTLQFFSKLFRCIVHAVLSLLNCGNGKKVPLVTNPLLLKSATQLAAEIREGRTKSEDVVRAYIQRILEVEPYINATVERPFAEAVAEAKEADALVASGNYTREQLALDKPLIGVPFSVKGLLEVKNLRCTSGSLLFKDYVSPRDSTSVELMKKAGAIVIATTNCPEFGMDFESNNRVHGKTCNPYGVNRTPGGSSGGESALVGAAGSVIGIGNDLLGSIRVPCHFTGLYGHKPTMGLVPNAGVVPNPHPGMERFLYTGPMCRYAEDLISSMKVLSTHEETRLKFGKSVNLKKLKICYMTQIRSPLVASVDSEILGGLKKAIAYFENTYDVTSKEIHVPLLYDANRCVLTHISSPEDLKKTEDLKEVMTHGKASHINVKTDLLKYLVGKSTFTRGPLVVMNFGRSWPLFNENKTAFYKRMRDQLAKEFDHLLDEDTVLLMPTLPTAAPYHNEMLAYLPSTCYTSIFNILGLPSTQCPLGINRDGLPFGIQIVGRKYNDPLTIACAIELDKEFGGWVQPDTVLLMPTAAPYHNEMLAYLPSTCYTSIFNILGLPSTQCPLGINRDGLPFGIQIVGRKYNDPLTIACAIELDKELGGWVQPGSF